MKKTLKEFIKKENQPMRQSMYWIIYVSFAYVIALKTVEYSIMASYELIETTPAIAQYSEILTFFL